MDYSAKPPFQYNFENHESFASLRVASGVFNHTSILICKKAKQIGVVTVLCTIWNYLQYLLQQRCLS
jgi:hypothetical protein